MNESLSEGSLLVKLVVALPLVAISVAGCHRDNGCFASCAASPCGVKASSFGWNATNATKCLQAAFDSSAAKVVIDRQTGDWIVEPVFLRSNQEVVIEAGVTVRALKGAFKSPNDCLFAVRGVSNVVLRGEGSALLRMVRDDYTDRKAYCFSEWRHTLNIVDSAHVRVSDLVFSYSGGDGIYVGGRSTDVDIRRVDCRDHYRQGISITGAHNLTIADSRFTATKGTPPQCGIDFEPNKPHDRLSNCVVENCEFDGNASSGILFHLTCFDETTEPISIILKNCRARDNAANGLTMTVGANGKLNCPVQMRDMMGTDLGIFCITSVMQTVTIKTPGPNLRRFEIDTCGNTVAVDSPYSGQGLMADSPLNLFRETCRLYFLVPEGANKVHVAVTPEEPAAASLMDASGKVVASMPSQTAAATLTGERSVTTGAEVWSIDVKADEDAMLRLGASALPVFAVEETSGLVQKK